MIGLQVLCVSGGRYKGDRSSNNGRGVLLQQPCSVGRLKVGLDITRRLQRNKLERKEVAQVLYHINETELSPELDEGVSNNLPT